MKRVELKIPHEESSKREKTCLAFGYLGISAGPLHSRVKEANRIGSQILSPIATELRRAGYDFSDPRTGAKSFGVSGISCRMGNDVLGISAWPPHDGEEWQLRISRRWEGNSRVLGIEGLLWQEIKRAVEKTVANLEGARNLRWISAEEANRY